MIEVYRATPYMIEKYDGHQENGRTLRFVGGEIKYISLTTPDFFPSIAEELRTLEVMEIEINNDI
jgi:hypothetical protein